MPKRKIFQLATLVFDMLAILFNDHLGSWKGTPCFCQATSLWSTWLQVSQRWWGYRTPRTARILRLFWALAPERSWKNDIAYCSQLSNVFVTRQKHSTRFFTSETWPSWTGRVRRMSTGPSCCCDGASNCGTSHGLQGEAHPLHSLRSLFSALS